MTQTDDFKLWLQSYLLILNKDLDTDVYVDYLYEILTNFSSNPSNRSEIIENLDLTLESLVPNMEISICDEILNQYIVYTTTKELSNMNAELEKIDILSEIIRKDRNAIDTNKRERKADPRYALDYKSVDVHDSEDESYSEGDIDSEFKEMRLESTNKIDDVLCTFNSENGTKKPNDNNDKLAAIAVTKNLLLRKNLDSGGDDSDDSDYNPIPDESGKSNREAVDKVAQEARMKLKEKHQQKKDKDKLDRTKQKDQVKARKENEKKRTQKSEKRR